MKLIFLVASLTVTTISAKTTTISAPVAKSASPINATANSSRPFYAWCDEGDFDEGDLCQGYCTVSTGGCNPGCKNGCDNCYGDHVDDTGEGCVWPAASQICEV